jgi:hypothetical protein
MRRRGGDEHATHLLIGAGGGIRDPHYPRDVTVPPPDTEIRIVAAPRAPAGSGDVSRRWALSFPDGAERFAGVTRPEAQAATAALVALGADRWDDGLVEVTLAVVLSEGAGPYMIDSRGRITLVLGPHPAIPATHLAMGEPTPEHRVGLVRRRADGPVWQWAARRDVPPEGRVAALDALDAVTDLAGARGWEDASRR